MNKFAIIISLVISGCVNIPYSEPDKHGFVWFDDHTPASSITVHRVPMDVLGFQCNSRHMCACTVVKRGIAHIYIPQIAVKPDLLEHELKHAYGENHLSHKVEKCPI